MNKFKILKYISFSVLPLTIYSVQYQSRLELGNTIIWWILLVSILLLFWRAKSILTEQELVKTLRIVLFYLIWNLFCIIRGVFLAENYWDWKNLVNNSMGLLLPIITYASTNQIILQSILKFYFKYTLPLFLFFAIFISTDVYGFYLIPITFLMLFFPLLTKIWKIIVVVCTLLVLTVDLDARSNVIRFTLPVLLLLIYYFRYFINVRILEVARKALFVIPILLFVLAISGIFNIFRMDEYIKGDYKELKRDVNGQIIESDLKGDSRTFLYIEVLNTAQKYNSWFIGRSPARGNISESFGLTDLARRGERNGNEVAILNIFIWTGLIGILLCGLIFYKASYLAINQSNNIFSKMVGLFVSFRWLYGWVEDINEFKLNYFFLWLIIGLCFSKSFRLMSNREVKYWIRGIFDRRYKIILNESRKQLTNSNSANSSQP